MSLLSRLAVQAARAYGILSSNKNNVSASYLVVAGGAGGGNGAAAVENGGGGGAGGYLSSTATLSTLVTYSVTVGAGGSSNTNGSNSILSGTGLTTITSTGGGRGDGTNAAAIGGSGGGGGGFSQGTGAAGTSGQGNSGGNGGTDSGGGGGGASQAGANGNPSSAAGGNGSSSSISGSSVTYAGGGGGAGNASGSGGSGGGGAGGDNDGSTPAVAGTVNTGGGGGGGRGSVSEAGAAGGSGIVIISYASATPKFVGGTLTTSGGNQIHTFTSSGTLSPLTPVTASYLVVAGGGGAVGNRNGGGGAGGLLTSSTTLYSGATYVVTVGAGGAGGAGNAGPTSAQDGSNSVLSGTGLTTLTATGGGGGGGTNNPSNGRAGGSGGGAGGDNATGATGGTGVSGQGFAGGTSATGGGAGGGGASAVGSNGTSNTGGNGGAGTASSISGTSTTYAGGGGGGATTTAGTGGAGGGGNGAQGSPSTQLRGVDGTQNTGGGAGGGSNYATTPVTQAAGGSGVVIISYAGSQVFNGGLVTSSGGNTIHTFTATGALTPLTNNLNNSLRFRSSASAYLNRTLSTPTNNKIFTYSAWVKRGALGGNYALFSPASTGTGYTTFRFESDDTINFQEYTGSAYNYQLDTTQVFRDPSAWYHLVVAVDTTQGTAANRIKLYVNGNQVTAFATATYPTQNLNPFFNSAVGHNVGANIYSGTREQYFDGYMTDINFIDGQALEPYYFGNNDANGVWKPILYKGTYGTNGFYLTFGNTTSTTTLGYDSSPNGNNWTTNNISLTAGVTYDAMTDVPTNTSATVANYAVMNPLNKDASATLVDGNLRCFGSGATNRNIFATMSIPSTQKIYFEANVVTGTSSGNYFTLGIAPSTLGLNTEIGTVSGSFGINSDQAAMSLKRISGTATSYGAGTSYATNDIVQIAIDQANGRLWFGKNNTWFDSGNPSAGTNPATSTLSTSVEYFPCATFYQSTPVLALNFGQRPFTYTPPTGFVAINTFNLPTPTILQGNKYMDATLWTGVGPASQVIVNQAQFKPDLVWVKNRSSTRKHNLYDSVRGTSKRLVSNSTAAEDTVAGVTAFNSNGMTLGDEGDVNANGLTFVGWQWQAGQGSTSSNTQGTITTTTSVNTTAGFSVFTFTGTGASSASIGHGLGIAPKFIIFKQRNGVASWNVLTNAAGSNQYGFLDLTTAFAAAGETWTSTVINIGANFTNGSTYVCYAWAEIAGFSKFGSYTGNGSADGPFVYTGFRPEFVMIKNSGGGATSSLQGWIMMDTSRSPFNQTADALFANNSNASNSGTSYAIDILSNGFKTRGTDGAVNESSATYIYMAFAEHPFKISNSR